ncbi:MAG: BLUF domain-containing protein [Polaromonas sp.]|nr:BLUF domain-containing protein [Polaromonas sp.]
MDAANQLQQPKLATIAYRSKATAPFCEGQLHELLITSQANKRESGLTGLLIYDEGKFFQWIEGDPDCLTDVWNAIQHDQRHTDIELLGACRT